VSPDALDPPRSSSSGPGGATSAASRASLAQTVPSLSTELASQIDRYAAVRRRTLELCAPLTVEDQLVQPMADASPTKWHLAHTTWFFESFVLAELGGSSAEPFDPSFGFLFNSYYEAVGPRVERPRRGMMSRPGLSRIHDYRTSVDRRMVQALADVKLGPELLERLELGLHHEQQHQELILTDIKYVLGTQPLRPAYHVGSGVGDGVVAGGRVTEVATGPVHPALKSAAFSGGRGWQSFDGGVHEIGAAGGGFAFDNERPRHRTLIHPFKLATRPVSCGEVLAFIAEGGYRDARFWLSDGWQAVQSERWQAPLYWDLEGGRAQIYTLGGVRAVDPDEPACHLSYYEADALARWAGARLPTEMEWEVAAAGHAPAQGHFADEGALHPRAVAADRGTAADGDAALEQLFGEVWEWTSSSYASYPGFKPLAGALGEYNGKFMSGQQVLRGGSCFSPRGHVRASYRNFFPPAARWQMTGARLAMDL
jgi:ergothioneine biosynthesis protein EgtB